MQPSKRATTVTATVEQLQVGHSDTQATQVRPARPGCDTTPAGSRVPSLWHTASWARWGLAEAHCQLGHAGPADTIPAGSGET